MNQRDWPRVGALLAAAAIACFTACGNGESSDGAWAAGKDLIFVSIDTLRADRLPMYGADRDTAGDPEQLGSLAWLAQQGTVFDQCWAPSGKTVPSLATFWTGRFPLEHGAISNKHWIQPGIELWSERLRDHGYRCFARLANRSLTRPQNPSHGLARGFEDYRIRFKAQEPLVAEELLNLAEAPISKGEKLMLWAHFMAPHQPYTPPTEYRHRYANTAGPEAENEHLYQLHRQPQSLTEKEKERLRALYDAEVYTAGLYVQRLLSGLEAHYQKAGRGSLLENAIVVFFSDHGEELGDRHGYFLHAKSLFSGVIQVPLIIAGAGWAQGSRQRQDLGLHRVLPMVLHGVEAQETLQFAAWQSEFFSVRDQRWTLVHQPCREARPNGPFEPPTDGAYPYLSVALYDRLADPLEQTDVAADYPQHTRRLLAALHQWYLNLQPVPPGDRESILQGQGWDPGTQGLNGHLQELGYPEEFKDDPCAPWEAGQWNP
ncbi:MAG: hypothetical protein DWQ01_13965 [Planctomycetota bacterium]|nr:MAG: hypothetical protein DWQ01_13965 [Planctomycetota bacterium]